MKIEAAGTGIDIAPMMAARLRYLAKHTRQNSVDIRHIGQQLHDIGGLEAMQQFFAYADLGKKASLDIQAEWHCIGDWRY